LKSSFLVSRFGTAWKLMHGSTLFNTHTKRANPVSQVAFQEFGARPFQRCGIGVAGGQAMIQPCQEFQLREQMIGRGPGVDFQAEILIEQLVFQHHKRTNVPAAPRRRCMV
jgi:hypothetical protein